MSEQEGNDNNNISNENNSNNQNENKVENDERNIVKEVINNNAERPIENNNGRYNEVDNGFSLIGFKNLKNNIISSDQNEEEEKKEENINQKENKVQNDKYKKQIYNLKIIVLGEIDVGKTSVIERYIQNDFTDKQKNSITCEFYHKKIEIDKETVANLEIWDTCGEEKFMSLTKQYYNNSKGAIILFDLSKKESLIKVNN